MSGAGGNDKECVTDLGIIFVHDFSGENSSIFYKALVRRDEDMYLKPLMLIF